MASILKVQSVSDIITNSSSEVFICTYMPPLPHGESWATVIDRRGMIEDSDVRFYVYKYLKLEDPLEYHDFVKVDKPDELEFMFSTDRHIDERNTNRHWIEVFDKFVEGHPELAALIDGSHYLVSLSDHDEDYYDYDIDGEEIERH